MQEAGAEAAVIPDGQRSVSVNLLVPSQQTGAIIGKGTIDAFNSSSRSRMVCGTIQIEITCRLFIAMH
jgi:hypothetical protein